MLLMISYRHTVVVAGVRIGATVKQILDNIQVSFFSGAEQRRLSTQIHAERSFARRSELHVRAALAQVAHTLEKSLL